MNLDKFLSLLTEAKKEQEVYDKFGDKVPKEVLDKLGAVMKPTKVGRFYDDISMSIIKAIANGNNSEYIIEHPVTVYSILKRAKKSQKDFDIKAVDNFLNQGDIDKKKLLELRSFSIQKEQEPKPTKKRKRV